MAVSAPSTFVDGQIVTAAQLNSIKNGFTNLSQVVTGYPETGYTTTTYTAGTSDSGNYSKPNSKAYEPTNQTIASGTEVQLSLQQGLVNVSGAWLALAGGTFIVTQPGWYRIEFQGSFDSGGAAANTERRIAIGYNGIAAANQIASCSTLQQIANNVRLQCDVLAHLAAGDAIYPIVYHNNGSNLVLLSNALWGCWMHLVWEAPY